MKKQILVFAISLFTFSLIAQIEENPSENTSDTSIDLGNKTIIIRDSEKELSDTICFSEYDTIGELTHWGGIDMGINMLLTPDNTLPKSGDSSYLDLDYAHSFSWNFNLIEKKIKLVDNYVGLITGLSWAFNSYGLQNTIDVSGNTLVTDTAGGTILNVDSTSFSSFSGRGYEYSKNKLRTTSFKIPLLLEFNTNNSNNDNCFHIAAGVIGGWTFRTKHITKYTFEDNDYKNVESGDFNINKFTLDAQARVGYKDFTVFATYGLTPLFEDNRGPEVHPLTVGISIVPF